MGIFGRASAQIGAGVAAGLTVAGILEWATPGGHVGGNAVILFPTVAAVMFAVGLWQRLARRAAGWRLSRPTR